MTPSVLYDKVLILPIIEEEKLSEGGLYIPNKESPDRGTIMSVGPDADLHLLDKTVVFNPFDGDSFVHEDKEYFVLKVSNLIAVL